MSATETDCGFFEGPNVSLTNEVKENSSTAGGDGEHEISIEKAERQKDSNKIKRYEGSRNSKNEPSGHGIAKFINGDYYEGSFRRGLCHGLGVLRLCEGHRYMGAFRKGLQHGHGTQTYPDCSTYNGDWLMGVRHGYGAYSYSNKDVYEGNWCRDKKHGIGVYTFAENGLHLRGSWNEGRLAGPVEMIFERVRFHGYWDGSSLTQEGVFNFVSKYLLRGMMKCGPFDEYVWTPNSMERYSFACMPMEPLPVPIPLMECEDSSSSEEYSSQELLAD